ncbi:lecithin retinol acyltransferase family protein [Terrisporobacter hibernicus]|uniref:Lecithin retinol acyltransferase family protein n=1 Tax=Terrisporobacter hibernicus TaxID=2813371 RepID=A0AAX2ZCY3_9FIRM|nr:lecithin retinol acyltransferase family protein [Terrisporobacter hibernicus]UEL46891.1 lecithin retinol acyltransferase family protein [Terrisporobacter hibernicus]
MIEPEYGDVICVNHGIYNHFGIFVDKNHVIHYSGKEKDMFFREMVIDETDMENFLGESDKYYVYRFSQDKPFNVNRIRAEGLGRDLVDDVQALYLIYQIKNKIKFKVYTPEETVKRARSRIGERKFLLHANNCEHFAIWCKTGVKQSYQVNAVIKVMFVKYLIYEGY